MEQKTTVGNVVDAVTCASHPLIITTVTPSTSEDNLSALARPESGFDSSCSSRGRSSRSSKLSSPATTSNEPGRVVDSRTPSIVRHPVSHDNSTPPTSTTSIKRHKSTTIDDSTSPLIAKDSPKPLQNNNNNSKSHQHNPSVLGKQPRNVPKRTYHTGRWTATEHAAFLQGIRAHGHHWTAIARCVGNRSPTQVRSHAQKYLVRIKEETLRQAWDQQNKSGAMSVDCWNRPLDLLASRSLHRILEEPGTVQAEVVDVLQRLRLKFVELQVRLEVMERQKQMALFQTSSSWLSPMVLIAKRPTPKTKSELIAVDVLHRGLSGNAPRKVSARTTVSHAMHGTNVDGNILPATTTDKARSLHDISCPSELVALHVLYEYLPNAKDALLRTGDDDKERDAQLTRKP